MRHKVGVRPGKGEETEDGCRGIALFLAFDPWDTCLRCPPRSARFFDAAEKNGLISPDEAKTLSTTLIRHGAKMARLYNGVYSPFFSENPLRTILNNVDNLDHLSESALAIGGSWADRFFETCTFPLHPEKHLEVQSFRRITIEGEVEFYSASPWLAWIEALDLICSGPWAGIKPAHILEMVSALDQRVTRMPVEPSSATDTVLGRKIILPMLSRGLQGVVLGIFTDTPKAEMQPIVTLLTQFGETLSDVYADLRWKAFVEALEGDLTEEMLAREVINVISPIAKIVVSNKGRHSGYKIAYENNYLSGYRTLKPEEFEPEPTEDSFSVTGPNGAEIYVEPLANVPNLNPHFTRVRLQNFLEQTFGAISTAQNGETLSKKDVRELRAEYEGHVQTKDAALAKWRQYYVITKVDDNWDHGTVKISNSELKRFLESKGRELKTGYQVTSYGAEFEKIFSDKVTAEKTRSALSLSWVKGSGSG
jgi:hypothetical protein